MSSKNLVGADVCQYGTHYKIVDKDNELAIPCVITWKNGDRVDLNGFKVYCWDDTIDVVEFYNNFSENYCFYDSKRELWDDIMHRFDSKQATLDELNSVELGDWEDDICCDQVIVYDGNHYEILDRKTDELYYDNRNYKVVYVAEIK